MTFGSNQESNAVINIGLMRLSPQQWPKVGRGAATQQLKKINVLLKQQTWHSTAISTSNGVNKIHLQTRISAKERSHARYEVKQTTLHNAAKKKGSSIVSSNSSNALDQSNRDPVIKLIIRKKTYFSADRGICQL